MSSTSRPSVKRSRPSDTESRSRRSGTSRDGEPRRKRGRPSNAERAARALLPPPPRRARGRPSNAARDGANLVRRSRLSNVTNIDALEEEEADDVEVQIDYQTLQPTDYKVARETIDRQWSLLPRGAMNRVEQLLEDIERSVTMRLEDENHRAYAADAVQGALHRITRKLREQRFPRNGGKLEEDFDYEKILSNGRSLETQLTPTLHSIDLLKAETVKEQALLNEDKAKMAKMEEINKSEALKRQHTAKRHHALLQGDHKSQAERDDVVVSESSPRVPLAEVTQERRIRPIVQDLQRHIRSMKNNAAQVEGIDVAMAKSKALVQDVLYRKLDRQQYEHVVLG